MNKMIVIPPPVIALLLIGLAFGLDHLWPGLPRIPLPELGLVLMPTGLTLGLQALLVFRRQRTTFVPHGEPTALVIQGPYLWTRNPMYLGLCTALLGLAGYVGKLPLFLVAPVLFVIIDRIYIPYEEAKLQRLFGDSYSDLLRTVARWL